jgi:hypothetical protein
MERKKEKKERKKRKWKWKWIRLAKLEWNLDPGRDGPRAEALD